MKYFISMLIFFVSACSGPPCQDAGAETGKGIYERKCSNCHTKLPDKLDNYRAFSGHQEKLTDCELQALAAYVEQRDSVKK